MGQAAGVAARLCNHTHKPRRDCKCTDCCKDRCRWACNNPHKCAMAANILLDKLEPKWDPRRNAPDDGLELSEEEVKQNEAAQLSGTMV
ncbi:hypothetical protein IW262DRAFT_1281655 [Armillaria fumosa]|nr:hypothetical protein IW262DRAFT_1281655 [Armillaria fumosa]